MTPPHLSPPMLDEETLKRLAAQLAPEIAVLQGGKNELIRYAVGLALAAIVAYFSGMIATQSQLSAQKATEESHFGEVLRRLDAMQSDIRELRGRP